MTRDDIGEGSLKCVVIAPTDPAVADRAARALAACVGEPHVRRLSHDAFLVYCEAPASDVRDHLASVTDRRTTIFVAEFERWSATGAAVDATWLARRGH